MSAATTDPATSDPLSAASSAAASSENEPSSSQPSSGSSGSPSASPADSPGSPSASGPSSGARPAPLIYRPANLSRANPVPLVIALHASGGTPASFAAKSNWDTVANAHHFVVAYLGSATPAWKYLSNVPYVSSMITRITAQQNIDPRRVYVTGFSAGADAAYYIACRLSAQIAAVAPISGVMIYPGCHPARPVSVLSVFGTHDLIPLSGTPRFPSVYAVTAMWRRLDGCPNRQPASAVAGPVSEQTWSGCRAGTAVSLYIIHGGGHVYPHSAGLPPSSADAQFNATAAAWTFFAAHPAG